MGVYAEDFKAVADYVLEYDEVKKVVPEEIKAFEDKVSEMLVFFKLQSYDYVVKDILEYLMDEDEKSEIASDMRVETDEELKEVADKLINECSDLMGVAEGKFKEKTNISIYSTFSKIDERFYFEMLMDDVVELTPSAKMLKDSGIKFRFESWVDEW